ncbi:hypothetical protein M011DRAFT_526588 [Sporormia fimetaria CBS 119925]|uniref:Mid2 domain-containing protein n=1 Tax=Sporormia fimetaria CBS 119925 TaxID=1340428 RepID=A0A6A6VAT4_9PLEO|nr:hypothetical protein M011DRAFT_526588 [Sporormia fimetaria CBS 119925]
MISYLLYLWTLIAISPATPFCWSPNGYAKPPDWEQYSKCPEHTMCCGLNRPYLGGSEKIEENAIQDSCLPNGLCELTYMESGVVHQRFYRSYCSEPSWETCLAVCMQKDNSTMEVTPCSGNKTSEKWCCGFENYECCDGEGNQAAVIIQPTLNIDLLNRGPKSDLPALSTPAFPEATFKPTTSVSQPPGEDPSSTAVEDSEPTTTVTQPPGNSLDSTELATGPEAVENSKSTGLSIGAKAGIAVGAVAGFFIVIAFVVAKVLRRRKNATKSASQEGRYPENAAELCQVPPEMDARSFTELQAGDLKHELPPAAHYRHELSATQLDMKHQLP